MVKPLLDIKIEGVRDAQGRFARATKVLVYEMRESMRFLGDEVVRTLQAEAPVRTGQLKKGIRYRTQQKGQREIELRVTSEAPYTVYVIRGRGPVEAKNAKALRFEPGPPGSGFIFRKRVGPAKANPFVARAMQLLATKGEPEKTARAISRRVKSAFTGV